MQRDAASTPTNRRRSRKAPGIARYLRVWRTPLLLVFVALVFGMAAYFLVPSRASVRAPSPFAVEVWANARIRNVFLGVSPLKGGRTSLTAEVTTSISHANGQQEPPSWQAGVDITLNDAVAVSGCKQPACFAAHGGAEQAGGSSAAPANAVPNATNSATTFVDLDLSGPGQTSGAAGTIYWYNRRTFIVDTADLALAANGRSVEGQLPSVRYASGQGLSQPSPSPVHVRYKFAGASDYDWTGGPQPSSLQAEQVGWNEDTALMAESEQVSATNGSAENTDNIEELAVGALLGIAGAAIVGAIQEALHARNG